MAKVLIFGGAGCLGSHIVEHLISQGHSLEIVDNFSTGNILFIASVMPKIKLHVCDLAADGIMDNIFENLLPDYVIFSAASYDDPTNVTRDIEVNIYGLMNTVRLCRKYKVKKLINIQSTHFYGLIEKDRLVESDRGFPVGSYGISKGASEHFLMESGINYISLRLATVLCERLLIGPVPAFYRRLKSGQTCVCTDAVRDFVGLVDFLKVVELSLETDFIGGINISSGIATSISQVYASVNAALGKIGPVDVDVIQTASDDIKHMVLNPTLAESIFGISFEYDLDRWVNECVIWYEKQAEIEVRSHITSIKNKS